MSDIYHNDFSATNVYGRSMSLLQEYARKEAGNVHLDIGCGFGAIAPHINDLGLHYVGVDLDPEAIAYLSNAGFEAHVVELTREDAIFSNLSAILAGRKLSSITILDTLEHVYAPLDVMRAIRRLIGADPVPLVISVPNVTHVENVAKMVVGRFEYTVDGLLDRTHVIDFSHHTLERMTRQAGLVEIAKNDTVAHFPDRELQRDRDAFGHDAQWFRFVSDLRQMARDDAYSYQFVRAYLPAPMVDESWFIDPSKRADRPFLSIVMRTCAFETYPLKDILNCLSGQSDLDFEIILIGHKLDQARQIEVEKIIEMQPAYLSQKIRFLQLDVGNRTAPLNLGYRQAKGRYIVTLDDDDLVFGHYVETFRALAAQSAGKLLRVRCASQRSRPSSVDGGVEAAISSGPILPEYPARFDLIDHLGDNYTPCMSVAYPRELIHAFDMSFDETLTTAEDYDFMMRAYFLCGISESEEITCVYRRWQKRTNSAIQHKPEEWLNNRRRIFEKHDTLSVLLPAGALGEIRERIYQTANAAPISQTTPDVKVKYSLSQKISREIARFKRRRLYK